MRFLHFDLCRLRLSANDRLANLAGRTIPMGKRNYLTPSISAASRLFILRIKPPL